MAVLATGLLGLVRPELLARAMALEAREPFGRSEVRALGGLLAGAALFALWTQDAFAFAALGAAFVGALAARWIDLAAGNRDRRVWFGIFLDATVAVSLLFPSGA